MTLDLIIRALLIAFAISIAVEAALAYEAWRNKRWWLPRNDVREIKRFGGRHGL